jgi:hypothetical protein
MTFRDYAQGSFRMRGIGKGQKIQVYTPYLYYTLFSFLHDYWRSLIQYNMSHV